ncbi:hypothetical protein EUX98_g7573 [Antrodiella citrinella]|uniref:Uncharacterized protein n=1 Tax=Antrodiella citrinella TaxID=2447956 RepID=A0A4S4MTF3_9APHY|nr:hypothetical protein EUX98_g7573 [Antrodiella citrinella]
MCLLAAIALSSFVFTASPQGILDVTSIQVYVVLIVLRPPPIVTCSYAARMTSIQF